MTGPVGRGPVRSPTVRLARVLNVVGRTMITAGVLILLFVAYQLWGTGIREAQAQDRLQRQFDRKVAEAAGDRDNAVVSGDSGTSSPPPSSSPSSTTTPVTTTSVAPPLAAPPEGEVLGKIEIPKIGLSAYVVEGVRDADLKKGPGHYPETPLPGQKGNAAIAGHRTTYGAPFANIDDLKPGDTITVTTLQGTFTYAVTDPPHEIVAPSAVEVLADKGDNRLTLTACHPRYSASQRIIVSALLQGTPVPAPPRTAPAPPPRLETGLSGERAPKLPAILFGALCAAIWLLAWLAGKRWRKWPSYVIALPFFLVALFYFFENFSRLLPSNY